MPPRGNHPDSQLPWREDQKNLATRKRPRIEQPKRFRVVLYNDDYTPMEFVVRILENLFGKGPAEATRLMLQIHQTGQGIAGVYVIEIAETKVAMVHRLAERQGYPLRSGAEPE